MSEDFADIVLAIERMVIRAQANEDSIGVLSTGERLAVALVLNRPDLLKKFGYTMLEAVNRLGKDWTDAAIEVERLLDLPKE